MPAPDPPPRVIVIPETVAVIPTVTVKTGSLPSPCTVSAIAPRPEIVVTGIDGLVPKAGKGPFSTMVWPPSSGTNVIVLFFRCRGRRR